MEPGIFLLSLENQSQSLDGDKVRAVIGSSLFQQPFLHLSQGGFDQRAVRLLDAQDAERQEAVHRGRLHLGRLEQQSLGSSGTLEQKNLD